MTRLFSLLIICLLHFNFLSAKSFNSLNEARAAFSEARFEQSVVYLTTAIENESLNSDQKAEAHLLRGQSYLGMLNQMSANGQLSMLEIKRGLSIRCFGDLNDAKQLYPKIEQQVGLLLDELYVHLLQEGLTLLGSVDDNPYHRANQLVAKQSLDYFNAAAEIHPGDYMIYKYRSMAYDEMGNTDQSLAQMIMASDQIRHVPPSGYPDFDMFNLLLETGEAISTNKSHELAEALDLLNETEEMLADEKQAFEHLTNKYPNQEVDAIEQKFDEMSNRVAMQSYKLRLNSPKHHEATLKEIVTERDNSENSLETLVSYGKLLIDFAPREAMRFYKKAIAIDAEYGSAHQEAGELIYDRSLSISKEMSFESDYFKIERLQREYEAILKMSIPYLKKALDLEPDNQYLSITLQEVYFQLDMMPQYYAIEHQ